MQTVWSSRLARFFLGSAGLLLIITAVTKFIASGGSSRLLDSHDPLLFLSYRAIFLMVGSSELAVGIICLTGRGTSLQVVSLAWLATGFAVYRAGLIWIDYRKPCNCLGNLTDALHISPQAADNIMQVVLLYLLIGSYSMLIWRWKHRRTAAPIGTAAIERS